MFIEPEDPTTLFAPEERDIQFAGQHISLLRSEEVFRHHKL